MVGIFNYMEIIQSIILIISALLFIIATVGILRLNRDMDNVVYARIHILGVIDIAGVLAFLGLGQPFFAILYFILAPFLAHALANAYYYSEDEINTNEIIDESDNDGSDLENNFEESISKDESISEESSDEDESISDEDISKDESISENGKYTVSTLKINEDR